MQTKSQQCKMNNHVQNNVSLKRINEIPSLRNERYLDLVSSLMLVNSILSLILKYNPEN